MTIQELFKFLKPLQDKISLMIGVAILTAIKNSEKTQKLQIQIFDEMYDDLPRMQEYGFETYPDTTDTNNECLVLSISGNKNIGIIACVHNRELRPKTLEVGEVQVYSKFGQQVYLKADGTILIKGSTVNLKDESGNPVMLDTIIDKFNQHNHLYNPGPGAPISCGPPQAPNVFVAGTDSAENVKAKTG